MEGVGESCLKTKPCGPTVTGEGLTAPREAKGRNGEAAETDPGHLLPRAQFISKINIIMPSCFPEETEGAYFSDSVSSWWP